MRKIRSTGTRRTRKLSSLKRVSPDRPLGDTLVEAAERFGGLGSGENKVSPAAVALGHQIRRERQARGLTQQQLGSLASLAQSDVSDIERGSGADGPSVRIVGQIADALGIWIPIGGAPHAEKNAVFIEGDTNVCLSNVPFSVCIPLLGAGELQAMRAQLVELLREEKITKSGIWKHSNCMLLRVPHQGKAYKLSTTGEPVVIAVLGGRPKYRWTGKFFQEELAMGKCRGPIGVLGNDSFVSVEPEQGDDTSLVIVPASALLEEKKLPC